MDRSECNMQHMEIYVSDTNTINTTPPAVNEHGFILKKPSKVAKAPKVAKVAKAPKVAKTPRVTKMSRALDVFRANKDSPLKDVQAKIADELGVGFERAYGYVRAIVTNKLA